MLTQEHKDKLQGMIKEHNGKPLNQEGMLKPNIMIGKVLVARFLKMTPQQQQSLKSILTPDTAQALEILLPELTSVLKKGMSNGGQ